MKYFRFVAQSTGLISVTGGKLTTYRKMAEDTVDQAAVIAQLDERPCATQDLNIHGYHRNARQFGDLAVYGSDAMAIREVNRNDPVCAERLQPSLVWMADHLEKHGELQLTPGVRTQLSTISISTVRRILARSPRDRPRLPRPGLRRPERLLDTSRRAGAVALQFY